MSEAPAVSIVVPTRGRRALLAETLESVRAQAYDDWECVVVDDGSTDGSIEMVQALARRDARFRSVTQEPGGVSRARNHGARLARGRYLAFLDSDDLFPADRLAWEVPLLDANPEVVLSYGNAFHFRNGDVGDGFVYLERVREKPDGDAFEDLLVCPAIYSPTVRTDAFRRTDGFDATLRQAQDWDMWLRIARLGPIRYTPTITLYYRLHEGNNSARTLTNYRFTRRVLARHVASLPLGRRLRVLRRARRHLQVAYTPRFVAELRAARRRRNWREARELWRTVVPLDPSLLRNPRAAALAAWACLPTTRPPLGWGPSRSDAPGGHAA